MKTVRLLDELQDYHEIVKFYKKACVAAITVCINYKSLLQNAIWAIGHYGQCYIYDATSYSNAVIFQSRAIVLKHSGQNYQSLAGAKDEKQVRILQFFWNIQYSSQFRKCFCIGQCKIVVMH